jgi:hypothetical protein
MKGKTTPIRAVFLIPCSFFCSMPGPGREFSSWFWKECMHGSQCDVFSLPAWHEQNPTTYRPVTSTLNTILPLFVTAKLKRLLVAMTYQHRSRWLIRVKMTTFARILGRWVRLQQTTVLWCNARQCDVSSQYHLCKKSGVSGDAWLKVLEKP